MRLFFLVDHDAADGRRLQRVDDEGRGVRAQGMMSIFSPCISCTTAWTRLPFMPTQAPTGSIELSWLITPILARLNPDRGRRP